MAVAFVLQSYVTQTHIHFTAAIEQALAADVSQSVSTGARHVSTWFGDRDRQPAKEDPARCPICQEILYAGYYVAPTAAVFLPPNLAVSTIAIVEGERAFVSAYSHNWQGRAPPAV